MQELRRLPHVILSKTNITYLHASLPYRHEAALTRDTPRNQIRGEGMYYLLSGTTPAWTAWELLQANKSTAERRNTFPVVTPARTPGTGPATSQAEHSVKFLWSPPIKQDATDRYTQHPGASWGERSLVPRLKPCVASLGITQQNNKGYEAFSVPCEVWE